MPCPYSRDDFLPASSNNPDALYRTPTAHSSNPTAVSRYQAARYENPDAQKGDPARINNNPTAIHDDAAFIYEGPALLSNNPAATLYDVRDVFEWPQDFVVRYFIEEGDIETAVVRLDDTHAVVEFCEMLKQHSAVLSAGKGRLRSLIISQFKAEDILYVSKGLK